MSDPKFYDNGLDQLGGGNWENATLYFLLADGYTFDPTHVFVADIVPGSVEIAATGGASRVGTGGLSPARVVNNTDHRIEYHCDDPGFGAIDPGEPVSSLILFRYVTDDSDHVLISCLGMTRTTDGFGFIVALPPTGVAYTRSPP